MDGWLSRQTLQLTVYHVDLVQRCLMYCWLLIFYINLSFTLILFCFFRAKLICSKELRELSTIMAGGGLKYGAARSILKNLRGTVTFLKVSQGAAKRFF